VYGKDACANERKKSKQPLFERETEKPINKTMPGTSIRQTLQTNERTIYSERTKEKTNQPTKQRKKKLANEPTMDKQTFL